MNIVFEGPKGIGKSTIIRKTAEALKAAGYIVEIVHLTKETGGNLRQIHGLLAGPKEVITIFDRLHISEVIYTEATPGRELRFTKEELQAITDKVDFTVILNAADPQVLLERIIERDGSISDLDAAILKATVAGFNKVANEHDYLMSKEYIIFNGYDTNPQPLGDLAASLVQIVNKQQKER